MSREPNNVQRRRQATPEQIRHEILQERPNLSPIKLASEMATDDQAAKRKKSQAAEIAGQNECKETCNEAKV